MKSCMKKYNCKTCGFKAKDPQGVDGCFVTKLPINLETSFCWMHTEPQNIRKCDICHQMILPGQITILDSRFDGTYVQLCGNCYMAHP